MEAVARKNLDHPPKERKESVVVEKKEKNKQAVIPKSVLKDVLQASDKELEGETLFMEPRLILMFN